ncbi:class I SAM-dependent methyltransferase [Spirulina subsalsa FACHB-351]|uniref:Class I SAM-dependent methyltransferase n=1 Tax=Spirulina subsalsa FACHB-351 TaxID=234711 RepID=A0ABT3L8F0_9CYAN|nr:class I SAM-dependent methyltransferase [Spirulina subsalsa]MCW6037785.1 class I SAM-dependent methyltransferase [Spirulina subsalsa FACHB-351]
MTTKDHNYYTYSRPEIVQYYAQLNQLQPAEKAIFQQLQSELSGMKMLDIGVGGGRTTAHFAPRVASYLGIDYAPEMIAACQSRFPNSQENLSFLLCDARQMECFAENSFDFILFSFNGIDYISHLERLQVLEQVSRVGKSGGYFCFSSHNLQGIEQGLQGKIQWSWNPITTYANWVMWGLFRLFNLSVQFARIADSPYLVLRDESHNFRLQTYYIRPQAQLKQLEPYFKDIQIYGWNEEEKIRDESDLLANGAFWLYYLCRIR